MSAHAQFRLAWQPRDNAWFLNEAWVDDWLKEIWSAWQKKNRRRPQEGDPELEHLASYLTVLELLDHCIHGTRVYVINPEHRNPIDVDLVLDIGNSRTTGILIETRAQSITNLNDSYLLQLQDMDQALPISAPVAENFSNAGLGLSLDGGQFAAAFYAGSGEPPLIAHMGDIQREDMA